MRFSERTEAGGDLYFILTLTSLFFLYLFFINIYIYGKDSIFAE